jgi:hypothetical protein
MNVPWTFWLSLFAGFIIVVLETIALWQNRKFAKLTPRDSAWQRVYRWRYLFGLVLAVASTFLWYPSLIDGERFKVVGLPFVIMLFDQAGKDYVGTLTFPSFLADIVVWLLIPDLSLWLWSKRMNGTTAMA